MLAQCLPFCLSVCLWFYLFIRLSVCIWIYLSVCPSIIPSTCVFFCSIHYVYLQHINSIIVDLCIEFIKYVIYSTFVLPLYIFTVN